MEVRPGSRDREPRPSMPPSMPPYLQSSSPLAHSLPLPDRTHYFHSRTQPPASRPLAHVPIRPLDYSLARPLTPAHPPPPRAVGAPVATPIVRAALQYDGARGALQSLALFVGVAALPVAGMMTKVKWEQLQRPSSGSTAATNTDGLSAHKRKLLLLWLCMFAGSFPGLLAHGHAAAIMSNRGGAGALGVSMVWSVWRTCNKNNILVLYSKRNTVISQSRQRVDN